MSGPEGVYISSFTEASDGVLLAGGLQSMLRSENGGRSWEQPGGALDNMDVWSLLSGSEGLFRSNDAGDTWSNLTTGEPFSAVFDVAVDGDQRLFAATDAGINVSLDDGATWIKRSEGIAESPSGVYLLPAHHTRRNHHEVDAALEIVSYDHVTPIG